MVPLCHGASLLVHEATDSHISSTADPTGKLSRRAPEVVREKALSRGHSVPEMAGAFARRIGANALVLNHIGARYTRVLSVHMIHRLRLELFQIPCSSESERLWKTQYHARDRTTCK